MHHLAAYSASITAGATATDLAAVTDGEFTVRNSHLIFTDPLQLSGIFATGTGMLRPRFNVPTLNAIARFMVFPLNRSATVPSPANWVDLRDFPAPMPLNEEIAIEVGNDDAADQIQNVFLFLTQPGFSRNIPRGLARLNVRATGAVAGIAQSWSTEGNLTFTENLKGGWYSVNGVYLQDAGVLAYRIVFPNGNMVNGKRFRPGGIAMEAINNIPLDWYPAGMGEWGRFHSFEPPRLQVFANATGASTQEVRLDLTYLGERGAGI